jgi:hypothetical protein
MEANIIATILASRAASDLARSALPNAPVAPDLPHKPRRVRSHTAALLYRIADTLSPGALAVAGRPTLAPREGNAC